MLRHLYARLRTRLYRSAIETSSFGFRLSSALRSGRALRRFRRRDHVIDQRKACYKTQDHLSIQSSLSNLPLCSSLLRWRITIKAVRSSSLELLSSFSVNRGPFGSYYHNNNTVTTTPEKTRRDEDNPVDAGRSTPTTTIVTVIHSSFSNPAISTVDMILRPTSTPTSAAGLRTRAPLLDPKILSRSER